MNKKHLLFLGLICVLALVAVLSRRERGAPAGSEPSMPAVETSQRPSTVLPPPPEPRGVAGKEDGERREEPVAHPPRGRTAGSADVSDSLLASLGAQMRFHDRIRAARMASPSRQVAEGRRLLASGDPADRALGGILLFLNGALSGRELHAVVEDKQLSVPLAVADWVRDFGSDDEIAAYAGALSEREIPTEELVAFLAESASAPGGGRSALDLLLPRFDEEELAEGLAEIIAAPGVSPDALEQAVFKLLEPENRVFALDVLQAAAARAKEGDLLAESLCKWIDMARGAAEEDEDVPYKVWDTPLRDLSFLADSDAGLAVRTMANYLEYGLRRDDPLFEPVVEEGTWETAREFLEYAVSIQGELLPEERDALDRLAANLDRIKAYDPAFAPDTDEDAPPSPYADDEEVDAEILDEEDSALADRLFAEENAGDGDEEEPEEEVDDLGIDWDEPDDLEDDGEDEFLDDGDGTDDGADDPDEEAEQA